jgi:hypothetical protein
VDLGFGHHFTNHDRKPPLPVSLIGRNTGEV